MIQAIKFQMLSLPEPIRFFVIGIFNTLFGISTFTILYFLLSKTDYLFILLLSHIVATTVAFFTLKVIVFQTKGNGLSEYMRSQFNYVIIMAINAVLLTLFVEKLEQNILLSQILITGIMSSISYVLHKLITFKKTK